MLDLDTIKSKNVHNIVNSLPSNMARIGILIIFSLFFAFIVMIHVVQINDKIEVNAKITIKDSLVTAYVLLPYKDVTSAESVIPVILHTKNGGVEIKAKMNIDKKKIFIDSENIFWYIPLYDINTPRNVLFANGEISAVSVLKLKKVSIFKWISSLIINEDRREFIEKIDLQSDSSK